MRARLLAALPTWRLPSEVTTARQVSSQLRSAQQQAPADGQPDAKKAKAEANLLPEAQWLASNKPNIIVKVIYTCIHVTHA